MGSLSSVRALCLLGVLGLSLTRAQECRLDTEWLQRCVSPERYGDALEYIALAQTLGSPLLRECPHANVKWVWDNPLWLSADERHEMSQHDRFTSFNKCVQRLEASLHEWLSPHAQPPPAPRCVQEPADPLRERCNGDDPAFTQLHCGSRGRVCIAIDRLHRQARSADTLSKQTFTHFCVCRH